MDAIAWQNECEEILAFLDVASLKNKYCFSVVINACHLIKCRFIKVM